jgi:hypothetical protein
MKTTLNERVVNLLQQELGDDPSVGMFIPMFEGNILSIPEDELRTQIQKYAKVITDLLTG